MCSVWAGELSCSEPGINKAKVRSTVQLQSEDGRGVRRSLLPAVLEIPRLSLVIKVTGLGWIFFFLNHWENIRGNLA